MLLASEWPSSGPSGDLASEPVSERALFLLSLLLYIFSMYNFAFQIRNISLRDTLLEKVWIFTVD